MIGLGGPVMTKKLILVLLLFIISVSAKPKLTVVLVIDQFAAHYIPKLDSYLGYGIHQLLKNGIVYTKAFYPHAVLETVVGHTSLGTGTIPANHGVVANEWLTPDNLKHSLTEKSTHEIMVAPLTREFLSNNVHNKAIAISLKERAALGMVGDSAPAIWFDGYRNAFVSNKPDFVIDKILISINARLRAFHQTHWQLAYNDERYYDFPFIDNYDYASEPSLFLPQSHEGTSTSQKKYVHMLLKLPEANQLLLDMARLYIERTYKTLDNDGALVVWLSLSSLDKIGHIYGPFSREVIDMIYHLDKQIGAFMANLKKIVAPGNTLYVLTADHGVMPIPELIKSWYPNARRIIIGDLIDVVNKYIKKRFKISQVIRGHKAPHVYINQKQLKKFSLNKQQIIIEEVRKKLGEYPGISAVYDAKQLLQTQVPAGSIAWLFKNNIYSGRSGDLLLQVAPYTIASRYTGGTKHYTPYADNTHVPLMLYQPGVLEHQTITKPVWVDQITATLANLLGIKKADYMFEPLPMN